MKNAKITLIFILLFVIQAKAQNNADSLNYFFSKGQQSYAAKDYAGFINNMQHALTYMPGNSTLLYNIACGYSLNQQYSQAEEILFDLAEGGKVIAANAISDEDFAGLWHNIKEPGLKETLEKLNKPFINSKLLFSIEENDLIPEGLAYNPVDGSIFLSSIYKSKIVKIDETGDHHDFIIENAHGIGPTIGLKVDTNRNLLWVASGVHDYHTRLDSSMIGMSGLFAFDLDTGKLKGKYMLPQEGHFLNDLDIASDGTIYLSDSKHPAVYIRKPGAENLEKLLDIKTNLYPNGIALSPDNQLLYLTGSTINVIDLETKEVRELEAPEHTSLSGDGMYYYDGSLIVVQNGEMNRITRFYLDDTGYKITSTEVLEANHPEWIIPTTASIYNDQIYYIGTSQLRAIRRDGNIAPPEQLKPVQIRIINLK